MNKSIPSPSPRFFHRIVRTSGVSFLGKVGAKVLGMGHYILLYFFVLRAEGYGQLGFILAYVGIFSGLAEGGVTTLFIRQFQTTDKDTERHRLLGGAMVLLAIQGLMFWCACIAFLTWIPWLNDLPERNLVYFFSTLILLVPNSACEGSFRARFDLKVPVFANLAGYAVFLGLLIPGSPIDTLPEIVILWWVVTVARMGWVTWRAYRVCPPDFNHGFRSARALFRESAPLFFTRFATYFYYRIDQVMIRVFFPTESAQLGWYLSAVKWTEAANLIPAVLLEGIFPALSRIHQESFAAFRRSVQRVWRVFVSVSGLVVLGLVFLFSEVLRFDFANQLIPARTPLLLLSVNEGFVFLNLLLFQVLIASGFQQRLVKVTVTMVFANVMLNAFFFTTLFSNAGHVGAATATLLTEMLGFLYQIVLVRNLLPGTLDARNLRLPGYWLLLALPVVVCRLLMVGNSLTVQVLHLGAMGVGLGGTFFLLRNEITNLRQMIWGPQPKG